MWDWLTINPAFTMEFCMPKGMKSQEKIKAQRHRTGWRHCFFYSVLNSGGSDVTILDFYCTTITNYKNIYDNRIVMFTRNLKKTLKNNYYQSEPSIHINFINSVHAVFTCLQCNTMELKQQTTQDHHTTTTVFHCCYDVLIMKCFVTFTTDITGCKPSKMFTFVSLVHTLFPQKSSWSFFGKHEPLSSLVSSGLYLLNSFWTFVLHYVLPHMFVCIFATKLIQRNLVTFSYLHKCTILWTKHIVCTHQTLTFY